MDMMKTVRRLEFILCIEKPRFTRVRTICVWDIEFSYDVKDFLGAWNISVHKWLKYYVYLRMIKPGQHIQIVPILMTFVVSAIWHGFYPGYFLFFISSGLMDYIFKLGQPIYVLFTWMPTYLKRFLLL
jgi:MBOAT, membrane-bound O-acyltransferase family